MKTVAVVGATGYLGRYVSQTLEAKGFNVRYLVRNGRCLLASGVHNNAVRQVDVTAPDSLKGQLDNVDAVISCLGITRQKDGYSYMDIDYQANVNVLNEALNAGVKKFMYVSVFRGSEFNQVALCKAKEKFVTYLENAEIDHCIVRPTGFFSDMKDFWTMAQSGRVLLFGNGLQRLNPIHGKDLAETMVDALGTDIKELNVGGPEVFTHSQIATLAFESLSLTPKTVKLPDMLRRLMLWLVRLLLPKSSSGPIEFFLTVLAYDMVAPCYGKRTLSAHFSHLHTPSPEQNKYRAKTDSSE